MRSPYYTSGLISNLGQTFDQISNPPAPQPLATREVARTVGGVATIWMVLSLVSGGISTYHGYKRSGGSVLSAVGWGVLGSMFPVIVPAVAFAQGFARPKPVRKNRRRKNGYNLPRRTRR